MLSKEIFELLKPGDQVKMISGSMFTITKDYSSGPYDLTKQAVKANLNVFTEAFRNGESLIKINNLNDEDLLLG